MLKYMAQRQAAGGQCAPRRWPTAGRAAESAAGAAAPSGSSLGSHVGTTLGPRWDQDGP